MKRGTTGAASGTRQPRRPSTRRGAGRRSPAPAALLALALAASGPAAAQGAPDPGNGVVDDLLGRGLLQEAAWAAREAGDTARGADILARLDSILRSAPREARPVGIDSQGVSYTWRLDYGGGVEAIFKVEGSDIFCRSCGAHREVGAYRVDRLLGFDLTPMTVHARVVASPRDTLVGSAMYFIHGASAPDVAGTEKHDALRLFDAVIGNSDRHKSNWLVIAPRSVPEPAGRLGHRRIRGRRPRARPSLPRHAAPHPLPHLRAGPGARPEPAAARLPVLSLRPAGPVPGAASRPFGAALLDTRPTGPEVAGP
ncbi:MAG: hypothetical protein P8177_14210 [Gemmatimonadota bacterium]